MKVAKLLLAISLLSLVLSAQAFAQQAYYVDPNGDDANPGTLAEPWKTIGKANQTLRPRDTVFIREGEYEEVIRPERSGSQGQQITYTAYQDEKVVITNSPGGTAIILDGRSYIMIDGLEVTGKRSWTETSRPNLEHWVSMLDAHHNIIRNSTFKHAKGWDGITLHEGSSYNKIVNSRMDYVGAWIHPERDTSLSDMGDILVIRCAYSNLVEGNTLTHSGHTPLTVYGYNNVVRYNTIDNKWGEDKGNRAAALSTVTFPENKGCGNGKDGYNVFEHNVLKNTRASVDDAVRTAQMKVEGIGQIVRRNFILDGHNMAIKTETRDNVPVTRDNKIYHNVIYANGGPIWSLTRLSQRYDNSDGFVNKNNTFKNNVAYMNRLDPPAPDYDVDFRFRKVRPQQNSITVVSNAIYNEPDAIPPMVFINVAKPLGRSLEWHSLAWVEEHYPESFSNNMVVAPGFVPSDSNVPEEFESPDSDEPEEFKLRRGSALIDEGAHLTKTTGAGAGTVIKVEDAGYFFDGFGIVDGDQIQVEGHAPVEVVEVNYEIHEITVDEAISWQKGDGVSLPYEGDAPDIGAWEFGLMNGPGISTWRSRGRSN